MTATPTSTEHHIPQGQDKLYARDYSGDGPAFVLMHGFPDNPQIYDRLIPSLAASGRRIVAFDFLGFGASEKPVAATYSFEQQIGDLEAVVDHLGLETIVPVAHDSSGIVALNSAYAEDDTVLWPEMITLFATPGLQALAMEVAQTPAQLGWLPSTSASRRFRRPISPAT